MKKVVSLILVLALMLSTLLIPTGVLAETINMSKTKAVSDYIEFSEYVGIGYSVKGKDNSIEELLIPQMWNGRPVVRVITRAFANYKKLTTVSIPSSVTGIDHEAFRNCTSLRKVEIESGALVINQSAFDGCTALKSIIIPESVKRIGPYAFRGCTNLSSVTIPSTTADIDENAFVGCKNLKIHGYEGTAAHTYAKAKKIPFISLGTATPLRFELTEDKKGYVVFSNNSGSTHIEIPRYKDGFPVIKIGDSAFRGHAKLESVIIPDTIREIGSEAFIFCENLRSVDIPASVVAIGDSAFGYCSNLENVQLHDGLLQIGEDAFYSCAFESMEVPDSVTTIGIGAFNNCTNLITVKTHNSKKDTVKIKVVDPYKPTKVELDQSKTVTLKVGETIQLKAELAPATAQTTLKWSTSSKKVVIVEDGLVTAVKKGNATITVKTTNGKKDTVKIKVVPAE